MSEPNIFLLTTGPHGERKIPLDQGGAWMIGRTKQHPIALVDDQVSRNHALIQCANPGEFYLIDMGSRNGSLVNGRRVSTPRRLTDGDRIEIGASTLVFRSVLVPVPEGREQTMSQTETRVSFAPRLLTVLVVDIRDFTRLAQQVSHGLLCEAIGTWFRLGGQIAQGHGSWTHKYIGDAIMSVWLHALAGPKLDLLPVLRAYLDLARVTTEIGNDFKLPQVLRIGGGINTGVATVGNAGSSNLADFTAMGDTVNAAFRLETATKQVGADLVVGPASYEHLRWLMPPEPYFVSHVVELKGYDQPATVWAAGLDSVQSFVKEAEDIHGSIPGSANG